MDLTAGRKRVFYPCENVYTLGVYGQLAHDNSCLFAAHKSPIHPHNNSAFSSDEFSTVLIHLPTHLKVHSQSKTFVDEFGFWNCYC